MGKMYGLFFGLGIIIGGSIVGLLALKQHVNQPVHAQQPVKVYRIAGRTQFDYDLLLWKVDDGNCSAYVLFYPANSAAIAASCK